MEACFPTNHFQPPSPPHHSRSLHLAHSMAAPPSSSIVNHQRASSSSRTSHGYTSFESTIDAEPSFVVLTTFAPQQQPWKLPHHPSRSSSPSATTASTCNHHSRTSSVHKPPPPSLEPPRTSSHESAPSRRWVHLHRSFTISAAFQPWQPHPTSAARLRNTTTVPSSPFTHLSSPEEKPPRRSSRAVTREGEECESETLILESALYATCQHLIGSQLVKLWSTGQTLVKFWSIL